MRPAGLASRPEWWHRPAMHHDHDPGALPVVLSRGELAWCAVVFTVAVWAAQGCSPQRRAGEPPPARVERVECPPEAWATDGADAGAFARPMPGGAFKGQKRPPCAKDEADIAGGCWMELARKPEPDNCGSKGFAHEGRCYVPVQQAPRPPTSVEP